MTLKNIFYSLLTALILCCLTACDFKGSETAHPHYKNGIKACKSQEYDRAVYYFNRYLTVNYKAPQTHLQLAMLYDEKFNKPLLAIYHYQQFLKYAPNSPEAPNVKKWLELARKKYYYATRLKYNDPEDVTCLQNTLDEIQKKLQTSHNKNQNLLNYISSFKRLIVNQKKTIAKYESEKEKTGADLILAKEKITSLEKKSSEYKKQLEELRKKLNEQEELLKKQREDSKSLLERLYSKDSPKAKEQEKQPSPKSEQKDIPEEMELPEEHSPEKEPEAVQPATEKPEKNELVKTPTIPVVTVGKNQTEAKKALPTPLTGTATTPVTTAAKHFYTVQKGDTLIKISRHFYGTGRYYKLIFDANRNILSSVFSLKPGQVLEIPKIQKQENNK
jgi:nucleoid-associated protein YgaU